MNELHAEVIRKALAYRVECDPWLWRTMCAEIEAEIDWDGPSVMQLDDEVTRVNYLDKSGVEYQISDSRFGFSVGRVSQNNRKLSEQENE